VRPLFDAGLAVSGRARFVACRPGSVAKSAERRNPTMRSRFGENVMHSPRCSLRFVARPACLLAALAGFSAPAQPLLPNRDHAPLSLPTAGSLTLSQVRTRFGEPTQRIGADLWVYWNFPTAHPIAQREGDDTLIVHVVGDHARTIKLVNGAEVRALLRQLGRANRQAASTPPP
jgi:hypothetical protein